MQDQIIIFMALADGKSEVRCGTDGLSLHTRCVDVALIPLGVD